MLCRGLLLVGPRHKGNRGSREARGIGGARLGGGCNPQQSSGSIESIHVVLVGSWDDTDGGCHCLTVLVEIECLLIFGEMAADWIHVVLQAAMSKSNHKAKFSVSNKMRGLK